ncbi:MAG: glucose-6-phosphate dehydrogenase [Lentisphaeria bacterium]
MSSIPQNYWRANLCAESKPVPNLLVIFGASGDLTRRKLIPALYKLYARELFHPDSRIIGCARSALSPEQFQQSLKEFLADEDQEKLAVFLSKTSYVSGDYADPATYQALLQRIQQLEQELAQPLNRTFYLATPASLYPVIVPQLGQASLSKENYEGTPWRHVVLEKPFGFDLASAEALDRMLHETLQERQIYRIDHYLGKETVQNILMLRFANIIFEPIWNSSYIDHVQITAAETVGIEKRAGYYDKSGQLRDMFQNHMLAMLSLVAMEAPAAFDADSLRDEQLKLIRSIRPFTIQELGDYLIRGQYSPGQINGKAVPGYREEPDLPAQSNTETYVAAKVLIDNWRWRGVPFLLRTGKRLPQKLSEIAITFKRVPHSIFPQLRAEDLEADTLVLNVQPEEGMALSIQAKQPGSKLCMGKLTLNFSYAEVFGGNIPDAYERLLLDCMLGDQTLFIRSDVIAAAWKLLTPILEAWKKSDEKQMECPCALQFYAAGSEGPEAAKRLFKDRNATWRKL